MFQEQTGWDYSRIFSPPSIGYRLYVLLLLVASMVGIVKLVRLWWAAPPFRLSRVKDRPRYLDDLAAAGESLQRWISATFLGWALLVSFSVVDVAQRLLKQREPWGGPTILVVIMDYSQALNKALVVTVLLFLIRWHVVKRIDYLRKQSGGE